MIVPEEDMFIRTVHRLVVLTAFGAALAIPAPVAAQDAAALVQELQKGFGKEFPRAVRLTVAGSGYKEGTGAAATHYRIEPHTMEIDAASPQALGTPIGFVAAAMTAQATVTTETLFGTTYKVISFTAANGQPVRGYVTEQNVLERIRSERVDDKSKVPIEAVFSSWQDFDGVRFPSLLIRKVNDQVQGILVVTKVETGAGAAAPKS
jgi:hypothetical protein